MTVRIVGIELPGAFVIELEPSRDDRGWFERTFDREVFAGHGLETSFIQHSTSFNHRRGTLRGMHYQVHPFEETKLVRCVAGAIYDVIVDIRPSSPTFKRHFSIELAPGSHRALYVPPGFAHGFLTLEDATSVAYLISQPYSAEYSRGIRWNDPALSIPWPAEPSVMSTRDSSFADFTG